MPETEQSYQLLAQSFVVYVDLFIVVALWLIHRSNKRPYLALAIAAGLVEASRQIPDFLISVYPQSGLLYLLSLLLRFTASLLFLAALLRLTAIPARRQSLILAIPIIVYVISTATLLGSGLPGLEVFVYAAPLILATFLLVWAAANAGSGWTPSRFLLTGTSFMLLVLRIWMTGVETGDIFYLLIYTEYLVFPMLLAAMILLEAELTNQRVQLLLEQRTQASEDLQFIVDNTDEIILISNEVGLVQSWSAQAARKFGYSAEQAINKLHMDELFAQMNIGHSKTGTAEFQTKLETADGSWFKARVSMKTVSHRGDIYNIYVLKDVVEAP